MDEKNILSDERADRINENIFLIQKEKALAFGTDAYMLFAFMRDEPKSIAAELGSGSGVISILAATRGRLAHIDAFEIMPNLAETGVRNIKINGMCDKIRQYTADIRDLDASFNGKYDVVFSNPPYLKTGHGAGCRDDEKNAAKHETAGTVEDFCAVAARLLKYGGRFYCVYKPYRLSELIRALTQNGLEPKRMTFVHADTETEPSIVLTESKLGGRSSLNVTKPLILFESGMKTEKRYFTKEARDVYETGRLF